MAWQPVVGPGILNVEEKCWLDIHHWGADLVVRGQIPDIEQKVLKSSFQTGSCSSPTYFRIFFLIAFLEEDFIMHII